MNQNKRHQKKQTKRVYIVCSKHVNAKPKNYFVTEVDASEIKDFGNCYVYCEERGKYVYFTGMKFNDLKEAKYYCAEMNRLEMKEKIPLWQ